MNISIKTTKMVMGALFASIICVATLFLRYPVYNGYIHIGDAFVMLAGFLLGPLYGGVAAGIGSAAADIFGGYVVFAPATFVAKFLAAAVCGVIMRNFKKLSISKAGNVLTTVIGGIAAAFVIIAVYFGYEVLYEGIPAAIAEIIPNVIQTGVGVILSVALYPTFNWCFRVNKITV